MQSKPYPTFQDYLTTNGVYPRNLDGSSWTAPANERNKMLAGIGINDYPYQTGGNSTGNNRLDKTRQWHVYHCWANIISKVAAEKATICKEWRSLSNFAEWFLSQPFVESWRINADMLGDGRATPHYCPETTVIIPRWLYTYSVCNSNTPTEGVFNKWRRGRLTALRHRKAEIDRINPLLFKKVHGIITDMKFENSIWAFNAVKPAKELQKPKSLKYFITWQQNPNDYDNVSEE